MTATSAVAALGLVLAQIVLELRLPAPPVPMPPAQRVVASHLDEIPAIRQRLLKVRLRATSSCRLGGVGRGQRSQQQDG